MASMLVFIIVKNSNRESVQQYRIGRTICNSIAGNVVDVRTYALSGEATNAENAKILAITCAPRYGFGLSGYRILASTKNARGWSRGLNISEYFPRYSKTKKGEEEPTVADVDQTVLNAKIDLKDWSTSPAAKNTCCSLLDLAI